MEAAVEVNTGVNTGQPMRSDAMMREQIRSSSLLLVGRFLAVGLNFFTQVFIVRYLSTHDYGALAYGLAVVAFLRLFATLGLNEAVARFVPIYRERREYGKLFGTICLAAAAVVAGASILAVGALRLFSNYVLRDQLALALLAILLVLVPFEAVDGVLDGVFASLKSTRDIFFRKYVLGPVLKLGLVLLLVETHSSLIFLTYGLVVTGAAAVIVYGWLLYWLLRRQGLTHQFKWNNLLFPVRDVYAFVVPGISGILATSAIPSFNIFLLGWLKALPDVAIYRAAVPVAELNGLALASFSLLYVPSAAQLVARADGLQLNRLYWDMAAWMAVLSFPIFAVTFSFARPVTAFLYGERYAATAPVLSLLSLGSYLNLAFGFNLQTLKVLQKFRHVVVVSLLAVLIDIPIAALLIPRYGAVGAGIGAAISAISFNVLMQAGLRAWPSLKVFDFRYLSIYLTIALSAGFLFVIQALTPMSVYQALLFTGGAFVFVLAITKNKLSIGETFPELRRIPFLRLLLA